MSVKTLATIVIVVGFISDLIIVGGCAYIIFWLGFSGWWWLLCAVIINGNCVACYKLVNALLFDTPALTYGMEKETTT